jgi:hypothetical protein
LPPLLGFTTAPPIIGILTFRYMERAVRQSGSLEIA